MKYYFDVTETYIKTIGIEAESLEQAQQRVQAAYRREEFKIDTICADSVEYNPIDESDLLEIEEIEEFNCSEIVFDTENDGWACPVCNEYLCDRDSARYIDYAFPKYCPNCGTELEE